MLTPRQTALVKASFAALAPRADETAALFYQRLFALDPALRRLFPADMAEQRRKLMQALAAVVNGLDNLESLIPVLETLGRNHVRYGVIDRHYDTVGAALLWTLEQGLKDAWTPSVKSAWTIAYGTVAGVMRSAAASNSPALA